MYENNPFPCKEVLDDLLAGLKKALGENLVSLVVYGSVAHDTESWKIRPNG